MLTIYSSYNQSGFFNEGQIQYFKELLYETGIGTNSLSSSDKNKVELFLGILEDASKDKVEIDVKVSDSINGLIKLSNDFNVSCSKLLAKKIGDDEQKYCYHFKFIYKSSDLRVLFTNKYVYVIILSGIFIKKLENLVKLEYADFNSDNLKIQTDISKETNNEIGQKIVYEVSSELSYTLLSIENTDKSRAEAGGVYLEKLYNALISNN